MSITWVKLTLLVILLIGKCISDDNFAEENYGVKYASRCEACKVVADELQLSLAESGRSHDVVQTGYHLDKVKTTTKYRVSELRLIETLESVCDSILGYSVHKERTDASRFAKGMSQTFQTLHGLVNKGVKVDLGMPYELWDKPNAEITDLKTKCDSMVENYEDAISHWYFHLQDDVSLHEHLCVRHVLADSGADSQCLGQSSAGKGESGSAINQQRQLPDARREEL